MGAVLAWCGWDREPKQEAISPPLFVTHPPVASKSRETMCEDWVTIFRL